MDKMKKLIKEHLSKIIFFIFLAIFIIVFFSFKLNKYFTYENVHIVREFILGYSILGPIIIILLFIIFNLAVFPTFYFIFIAGYLYGSFYGLIIGWIGMVLGISSAFLNSRYLFRESFVKKFGNKNMVLFLEEYIKKYHAWSVLFLRIFFIIPYNIQNVAYGLTSINSFIFIVFSSLGVLPITILYALLGAQFSQNNIGINTINKILIIIIIFITVFAIIFIKRILYKKKLKDKKI